MSVSSSPCKLKFLKQATANDMFGAPQFLRWFQTLLLLNEFWHCLWFPTVCLLSRSWTQRTWPTIVFGLANLRQCLKTMTKWHREYELCPGKPEEWNLTSASSQPDNFEQWEPTTGIEYTNLSHECRKQSFEAKRFHETFADGWAWSSRHSKVQCLDGSRSRLQFFPTENIGKIDKYKNNEDPYFIIKSIRSGPSADKNSSLFVVSFKAEHRLSKTFSINSVSSASYGSRRRYCCIYKSCLYCRGCVGNGEAYWENLQKDLNTVFFTKLQSVLLVVL